MVYAYYRNPQMLARQFETWASYPAELLDRVEFIVVDDGSPEPAAEVPRPSIPLRIFRALKDEPWHQDGARNLGALHARNEWIFFGDMDHVVPESSLRAMLSHKSHPFHFYRFPRRLVDGSRAIKPAVNIFAVTRDVFWKTGGYDERYCGAYGSDHDFVAKIEARAERKTMECAPIDVYLRSDIGDACTTGLDRTGPENAAKLQRARAAARSQPPIVLGFQWERVA